MDVLTPLNRAIAYIEEHIADEIALADVSSVTPYSSYHFGRLFYYIADMPLSEYIRKRKLSLAAMALQSGNIKVIDLVVMYGYDSADSFTRAFVKQHGVTPSSARRSGVNMTIFPPLTFQIRIKGVRAMNWRIEEREAFEVFGIEGTIVPGNAGVLWDECFQNGSYEKLYEDAGGQKTERFLDGVCAINAISGYRETGDSNYFYMLCVLKNPDVDASGYAMATIPKATWAVFRSKAVDWVGAELPGLFDQAYSEWLPSSGYDLAHGPSMEIYYDPIDGKQFAEVWIPVVKK